METIRTTKDLREAIAALEIKSTAQQQALKERLHETTTSFKPSNLLKSAIHGFREKPKFQSSLLNSGIGLGVGLVAKRLLFGAKGGIIKKLVGKAVQLGVAKFVARKMPDIIHKKTDSTNRSLTQTPGARNRSDREVFQQLSHTQLKTVAPVGDVH
jgi:hypothetical protein